MNSEIFKKYVEENDIILLGKEKFRIFGITSFSIKKEIVDNVPECLKDRNPLASISKDKVLQFYNVEDNISRQQLMFILLHEVMHLICHHLKRIGDLDPIIFNIAADHVVNRELIKLAEETNILEPIEGIQYFPEIEEQHPKASVELVYDLLSQQCKQENQDEGNTQNSFNETDQTTNNSENGESERSNTPENPKSDKCNEELENEENSESGSDKNDENRRNETFSNLSSNNYDENNETSRAPSGSKDNIVNEENSESGSDNGNKENEKSSDKETDRSGIHDFDNNGRSSMETPRYVITTRSGGETAKLIEVKDTVTGNVTSSLNDTCISDFEIEKEAEEVFQNAQLFWNSGLMKGDLPGELTQLFTKIFKVEVPWDDILQNSIIYNVQASKKRSWCEPNFYIRNEKVPGYISKNKDPKILISVVDTSMSITDDIISKFCSVIVDSLDHYFGLYIIQHDTKITKETFFEKKPDKKKVMDDVLEIKGRGGTSHKDVFERIEKIVEEKDVSSIVFLTDYYSDVDYIYNDYRWIKRFESIWMLTSELYVELQGCKTKTVRIK